MSGILIVILNALVVIGIVASALVTVRAKKLIDSVIALAATGTFVGLEFILLQAPDVAIAEVSVGAVLSTILYIIALRKVNADEEPDNKASNKDQVKDQAEDVKGGAEQ